MSMFRLAIRSLCFHWRPHTGVLVGAMLASAILTGALLVGDSVRHSLHEFAMMRLGDIHFAMNTRNRFFSQELADELEQPLQ